MAIPQWVTANFGNSNAWEVLMLDGKRVPGVVTVGTHKPSSLDKKKPKGGKKAVVVDTGEHPVEFEIKVELQPGTLIPEEGTTEVQHETQNELDDFHAQIMPSIHKRNKGGVLQPITIAHPQAALWNVGQVMIGDVSIPSPAPGGSVIVSIKATEYREQPEKLKKQPPPAEDDWHKQAQDGTAALKNKTDTASNFSSDDGSELAISGPG